MDEYVRRAKEPEFLHRYEKCFISIAQAEEAFAFHRYGDCISSLYDAMDYFWKALRHLQNADARTIRAHMPKLKTWNSFMPHLVGSVLTSRELNLLNELFSRYNPTWEPSPSDRHESRYDNDVIDRPILIHA